MTKSTPETSDERFLTPPEVVHMPSNETFRTAPEHISREESSSDLNAQLSHESGSDVNAELTEEVLHAIVIDVLDWMDDVPRSVSQLSGDGVQSYKTYDGTSEDIEREETVEGTSEDIERVETVSGEESGSDIYIVHPQAVLDAIVIWVLDWQDDISDSVSQLSGNGVQSHDGTYDENEDEETVAPFTSLLFGNLRIADSEASGEESDQDNAELESSHSVGPSRPMDAVIIYAWIRVGEEHTPADPETGSNVDMSADSEFHTAEGSSFSSSEVGDGAEAGTSGGMKTITSVSSSLIPRSPRESGLTTSLTVTSSSDE